MSLEKLVAQSVASVREAVRNVHGPILLAYSGGKDSIVAGHLLYQAGVDFIAVCETSWYFARALKSLQQAAAVLGFSVTYTDSLPIEWLRKNRHIIFSTDTKVRAWSFAARQQATVKLHAKTIGAGLTVFGRRTEENSVRAISYTTQAGPQLHPIRDWKTRDVWNYFERYNLPVPWIYGTEFGRIEGNAPLLHTIAIAYSWTRTVLVACGVFR